MSKPGRRGWARLWFALGYSWSGLRAALRHEAAFRQELVFACVMIPLGVYLGQTPGERALLAGVMIWLLVVELLNTAIEAIVDRVGDEWHELAGRAKDLGSAAVLLSVVLVIVVWSLVLWS